MLIFGGKINIYSTAIDDSVPGLYYLLNFNSFGAGMITMYHMMIVNNWFVTVKMYTNVFQSTWPRVFFISFWPIVVLIVLNIVVSIVLDIYDSIFDEVEEFFKISKLTQELKEILKDVDDQTMQDFVLKVIDEAQPDQHRQSSVASTAMEEEDTDHMEF